MQNDSETWPWVRPSEFPEPVQHPLPVWQIISDFRNSCQAPESKIFCFRYSEITAISLASHPLNEGRIAIVNTLGWDAVDAMRAQDERADSVRQRRVVLTPRCWRQVLEKQAS